MLPALRSVLLLAMLLALALSGSLWLLWQANQSENAAHERSALIGSHAIARLMEAPRIPPQDAAHTALALLKAEGDRGLTGVLIDGHGQVVLTQPSNLLGPPDRESEFAAALVRGMGSAAQGRLDIANAYGEMQRAYFSKLPQGGAWVTLLPCGKFDPSCSRAMAWILGTVVLLFVAGGVVALRLAMGRRGAVNPSQLGSGERALEMHNGTQRQERMAIMGRLTDRFAHELNNQLGIISNSAYLIQRRAQDPGLTLPAQAMLRAVESASGLTHRMQKLAAKPGSKPQALELTHWLPGLHAASAMVLGKRVALTIQVAQEPLVVRIDPSELELVLTGVLLCVPEALEGNAQATLSAGKLAAIEQREMPTGEYVEICLEAVARSASPQTGQAAQRPQAWMPAASCDCLELAYADRICRAAGGGVWASSQPHQRVAICLVLPHANEGRHTKADTGPFVELRAAFITG